MRLHVLFVQLEEDYEGQHAPDPRAVVDGHFADEFPQRLKEVKTDTLKSEEVRNAEWFRIDLGTVEPEIREILLGKKPAVQGKVSYVVPGRKD